MCAYGLDEMEKERLLISNDILFEIKLYKILIKREIVYAPCQNSILNTVFRTERVTLQFPPFDTDLYIFGRKYMSDN